MFNRGHWKKFELTETGAEVASQDKKGEPSYNLDNADEKSFSTDFLTDRCIDFVGRKESEPFLAVVSYPDPHGPNTVRAPYSTMFDHLRFLPPRTYGLEDVIGPKWLGDEKGHTTFKADQMRQYFGMVKCLDDNIGRLLHALEANGKPVFSFHQIPKSCINFTPSSFQVTCPSCIIKPTSKSSERTRGIISSNGTTSTSTSPHASLNAKYALVPKPGMAIFFFFASSIVIFLLEISIGPYPSPIDAPQFIR